MRQDLEWLPNPDPPTLAAVAVPGSPLEPGSAPMTGVLGLSLVGREREVGLIVGLLDGAEHHDAVLVLKGVPGIAGSDDLP
jgi:hypothetical protein